MNDSEFEKKLSELKLAKSPDDYLTRGVELIDTGNVSGNFWHRHFQFVLASALLLSVITNVLQLVTSQQQIDSLSVEQIAQCNTPAAAATPTASPSIVEPGFEFADYRNELQPLGRC